jgi:hypothetical protein
MNAERSMRFLRCVSLEFNYSIGFMKFRSPSSLIPPFSDVERSLLSYVFDCVFWVLGKRSCNVILVPLIVSLALIGCESEQEPIDQGFLFKALLEDDIDNLKNALRVVYGAETQIEKIRIFDSIQKTSMPLIHAAAKYDSAEILEWLIANGTDAESIDNDGRVPGEVALKYGSKKSLAILKREPKEFSDQSIYEFLLRDPFFRGNWLIRRVNDAILMKVDDNFIDLQWEKSLKGVLIVGQTTVSGMVSGGFTGEIISESGYWHYVQTGSSLR